MSSLPLKESVHGCAVWMMQCGWTDNEIVNAFEGNEQDFVARNIADWRNILVKYQESLSTTTHSSTEDVLY